MIKTADLQNWGSDLSKEYLEMGKPMTPGLQKLATEHSLNSEQVQRIAEFANLRTHLEMLKTASSEAYIKFPLANPKEVSAKQLEKTAEFSDYVQKPEGDWKSSEDFFKTAGHAIKEETKYVSPNAAYNEAIQKVAQVEKLNSELIGFSFKIDDSLAPIYSIVKQAALGGTPADELEYSIRAASPFGDFIIDELKDSLSKDRINISENNLEKFAGILPNPENKLIAKIHDFHDLLMDTMKTAELYESKLKELSENNPLEKNAGAIAKSVKYIGKSTKKALKFMWNHPYLTGATGVYYLGKQMGKDSQKAQHTAQWANTIDLKNKMPRN